MCLKCKQLLIPICLNSPRYHSLRPEKAEPSFIKGSFRVQFLTRHLETSLNALLGVSGLHAGLQDPEPLTSGGNRLHSQLLVLHSLPNQPFWIGPLNVLRVNSLPLCLLLLAYFNIFILTEIPQITQKGCMQRACLKCQSERWTGEKPSWYNWASLML